MNSRLTDSPMRYNAPATAGPAAFWGNNPRAGGLGFGMGADLRRGQQIPMEIGRVLVVHNMNADRVVHPDQLYERFRSFGVIVRVKLSFRERRTGLVEFADYMHARTAMDTMQRECGMVASWGLSYHKTLPSTTCHLVQPRRRQDWHETFSMCRRIYPALC